MIAGTFFTLFAICLFIVIFFFKDLPYKITIVVIIIGTVFLIIAVNMQTEKNELMEKEDEITLIDDT